MLATRSLTEFLNEVASSSPAPGGGSVSALTGALGMALTSMVARLTIGKKAYADVQSEMEDILERSENLREQMTAVMEEDTVAFNKMMEAFRMPKETDEQKKDRNSAIQETTKTATLVPLKLLELCTQAINLARTVATKGNKNSRSDAGVAILLLQAAARGASLNVHINLPGLDSGDLRDNLQSKTAKLLSEVDRIASAS